MINANTVRRLYPEAFGIRKFIQRQKVRRLKRFLLSTSVTEKTEYVSSIEKRLIITPFLEKWGKQLSPSIAEIENIFCHSEVYKSRNDKEDLKTDMLFCRLAYGFLPSEYVCFELEKKTPKERKQFASDYDMNVFGYTVNNIREMQWILDKGDSYLKFRKYFHRDVIIVERESDFEQFKEFTKKHSEIVVKKVFSSMGKGIQLVKIKELDLPLKDYFLTLVKSGKYLIEEKIIQAEEMAKYNESSVNTVRSITFKIDNEIIVPYAFMRAGRAGSFVDNGGRGGVLIGLDSQSGELKTDGYDEFNNRYICHPDSGISFKGNKIPEWNMLVSICKDAHKKCTKDIGYLSWDLAYTKEGWDLVEVNEVGQFIGPQSTFKKGIRNELYRYMQQM